MSKKPTFTPSSYKETENPILAKYSEDDIMHARAQVEREQAKKDRRLRRIDLAWTLISTVFAIVMTSVLLAKNWVEGALSYVILAMLVVYIVVFLVLCGLLYKRPHARVNFKAYGKAVKIFKALTNIAFLVLTAITMAGVVKETESLDVKKWAVFILNLIVGLVKLAISFASLIVYLKGLYTAKNYSVLVTRYVDGKQQKKTVSDKRAEKKYKQ
ncbi:MAG: hypothetical protein IK048_05305 [Clostridia bacterium]|nr:hypothetical protein [Clostridia bacterium]